MATIRQTGQEDIYNGLEEVPDYFKKSVPQEFQNFAQ